MSQERGPINSWGGLTVHLSGPPYVCSRGCSIAPVGLCRLPAIVLVVLRWHGCSVLYQVYDKAVATSSGSIHGWDPLNDVFFFLLGATGDTPFLCLLFSCCRVSCVRMSIKNARRKLFALLCLLLLYQVYANSTSMFFFLEISSPEESCCTLKFLAFDYFMVRKNIPRTLNSKK